jgi:pyruvate dehydrogenase E1 component beta subunit
MTNNPKPLAAMNEHEKSEHDTQGDHNENGQMTPKSYNATMVDAINLGLGRALNEDESVVLFGEDVGKNGGVFRATTDLQEQYGVRRVMDTPLAEALIAGISVGMSSYGMRPVAEIQFLGFIYASLEHVISHASRLRNRTRGRLTCPMVIRAPYGGGIHAPEHHSESTEALFAHIPGLRVVVPSSPERAYGLLLSAIRNPDPVIFLEPKRIYRAVKQNLVDDGQGLPLDRCFVIKPGKDVTLVTWGAMLHETLQAARKLEELGIDAEIIDVATVKPLDMETIADSVAKTGRCVIVHEAARTCAVGSEISARLAEDYLFHLKAPVKRVCGYDTIMPYFRREQLYLPSVQDIVDMAQSQMSFT